MKKYISRLMILCMLLVSIISMSAVETQAGANQVFPLSNSTYVIKGYAYQVHDSRNKRAYVYYNEACTRRNSSEYVSVMSDECYIIGRSSSYNNVRITYPTRSGRKDRWTPMSVFTSATSYKIRYAKTGINAYKFASTGYYYGSISKNDKIRVYETWNGFVRVLYPIANGYKLAWIRKSDADNYLSTTKSLKNSNTTNNSYNNATYARYIGVRYDNVGLSSQRILALNKAKNMVTIQWKAPADFPTWCAANGSYNYVKSTDGTRSTKFIKGKTYTGIPYSMKNHTWDDISWKSNLNSLTTSRMSGKYYSHGKSTTANGIDCSYFVYTAFKYAVPSYNFSYESTRSMLNSRFYKRITLSQMKPGDIFLKNGHVMLYVGKCGSNYAVFEADAGDSKCSYNMYRDNIIKGYKYYRFKGFGD